MHLALHGIFPTLYGNKVPQCFVLVLISKDGGICWEAKFHNESESKDYDKDNHICMFSSWIENDIVIFISDRIKYL